MELKINKDFAKHYNQYRAKEEAAKTKKTLKNEIKQLEESSSSSDSEYEECYKMKFIEQCDDILKKIVNNKITSKVDAPLYSEIVVDVAKDKVEKPLYAKDLNRKIILEGGIENEEELNDIEKYAQLDSEDILNSMPSGAINLELNAENISDDDDEFLKPSSKPPKFVIDYTEQDTKEIESDIESDDANNVIEIPKESASLDKIEINRDRKLETVRVSKKTSRAEKRKARKENKAKELKEKLKRLKELKNINLQEKLDKIKKNVPEMAKHLTLEDLDDDFDIDEFSKRMSLIYEQEDADLPIDDEKPVFSDESDIDFDYTGDDKDPVSDEDEEDSEEPKKKPSTKKKTEQPILPKKKASYFTNLDLQEEEKEPKKRFGILRKTNEEFNRDKFNDFGNYLKKTFDICCEDLILGKDDSDDVKCKFKYRKVEEQTYGLGVEDIILADNKELNKWASLKKIVRIRTNADEEKDRKKYSSMNTEDKKREILTSLYKEESDEEEEREEKTEVEKQDESEAPKLSKSSKKRLRKKTNKKQLNEFVQQIADKQQPDSESNIDLKKPKTGKAKKRHHDETESQNMDNMESNDNEAKKSKTERKINSEAIEVSNSDGEAKKQKKKKKVKLEVSGSNEKKNNSENKVNEELSNKSKKRKLEQETKESHEKQKTSKKKKSKTNSVPVLNNNRLESLGIKEGYYKHVMCNSKNVD